mgnify:CR=1 FL=1
MNKTIPVFDEAGNYIKDVFPRYAIQRVLKGQAIWIKRSSAIQVLKPCPILSVFPSIGVSFSVNMKRIHEPLDLRVYGTRRMSAANSLHTSMPAVTILAKILI